MKDIVWSSVYFIFAATFGGCVETIERQEPGESIGTPSVEPEGGSNPEAAIPEPGGEDPLIGPVEGKKTVFVKISSNAEGDVFVDKTNAGCQVHKNLSCTLELTLGEHEIRIWPNDDGLIQADEWTEWFEDESWETHDITIFTITPDTAELFIPLYPDLTGTWVDQNGHIFDSTVWFEDPESDEEHRCPTTWARTNFYPLGTVCLEHEGTFSLCKDRSKACINALGVVIEEGSIYEDGSKLKASVTFLWQEDDGTETPQTIVYERWEN